MFHRVSGLFSSGLNSSLNFVDSGGGTRKLTLADADFGFIGNSGMFSFYLDARTLGAGTYTIIEKINEFYLNIVLAGNLNVDFGFYEASGTTLRRITTNDPQVYDTGYIHIIVIYGDTTASNNRVYFNGVQAAAYTNQEARTGALNNTANIVTINADTADMYLYKFGITTPSVFPTISDYYNATTPIDLASNPDIYSYLRPTNSIVYDSALGVNWTQAGTENVTLSSNIP